ncbi:MAG TPA: exopolysaccharide transport family protein, partial [Bryobacteraceae bacterium]|nr:exopolysaccharide transport family protein [Bryobacteraceae bacterium]
MLLALGIVAGVGVALLQTPYYRARASVELDGVNDQYLNSRDVSPDASSSLTDGYMETEARLLGSESVVGRALHKLPPRSGVKKTAPSSLSLSGLLQKTGLKQFTPAEPTDSGIAAAQRNLTVRALTLTRVIEVTYDDPDPNYASLFTNTLLDEYIASSVERRWEATQNTERWLNEYVARLKEHLESSSQNLESYATNSGLLGTKANDTPAEAKLRDLQADLSKVHVDRISKQALYETAMNSPQDGLSPTINPSPLREYQAKLSDLRSERAQLVATLTPEHFRVQRLDSQISEMEQLVKKEWAKTLMLVKSEYESAQRQEQLLTDSVRAQTEVVAQQAGKRVHYDMLRNELDTNQQVYSSMLQKAKESAVLAATKPTNVHIIDPAQPPAFPFKPNLSIYGSVGGLSGIFLGLVWAAYSFRQERDVIVPGMLSAVSQVRELGVIPSSRNNHYAIEYPSAPGMKKLQSVDLFMFSESFNATVASILNAECNGTQARLITITSALAGEGKTTVVTNLGRALAGINRRVVLVDGDLRSPKLSASFDIDNTWGLNDILQSNDPIDVMPFEAMAR